ncbi:MULTISPECIES: EAL domain-containing protein [unclassified Thioalkalivibrio]|uniref:bifunctional diguanylate cyclase/phosphodiesterase n=1 Tax=unclassified Thioalkalivibrio TaxID=2621013 RepID=UPI0003817442|nr:MULTISPECIES: EAL domain-containing protein [unclassified Thioalkalivibrio]
MNALPRSPASRYVPLMWLVLLALFMLPVLLWMVGIPVPPLVPLEHMTAFHTATELFAVVVAIGVFAVAYHVRDRRRVMATLVLATGFLAVGLLDFLHLMTYPQMPDFITPNSSQQTIFFWLAARLVAATALLLYVALPLMPRSQEPVPRGMLVGALALVAVLAWVGLWHEQRIPALFVPGEGLTPFKIALEGVVVVLHAATLLVLLLRPQLMQRPGMPLVAAALMVLMASEVFFTLYDNLSDGFFVLGHIYKVAAYALIYWAVFIESVRAPMAQLRAAHRDVELRQQRYEQLIDTAPDGVLVTDGDGTILMANRNLERLFGYPRRHLIGQPVETLIPERLREHHQSVREQQSDDISERTMGQAPDLRGRRLDGTEFPVDISLNAFEDQGGRRITAFIRDISDRQRREARIQHQATHDSLTGLPNRWLLHDRLAQSIAHASRHDHRIAVMLLDLDHFKMINDTFGHHEGDELLREVAQRLKDAAGNDATIGRFGGDEFMILVPEITDELQIGELAQEILAQFDRPFQTGPTRQFSSSASLGIALFPQDARDANTLVRYADMAMYEAKRSGRNTYAFYSEHLDAQVRAEQQLQERLKHALEHDQLALHFQPLIDARTGAVTAAEALLRWNDRELGAVPPSRFIPSAEANGLILPLGDWVIRRACQQLADWAQQGVDTSICINVSALQFRQPDLVSRLEAALKEAGASPERLEIEVTETVAMADVALTREHLSGLKALGVRVSLDDFGTGYSSLAYLKSLPIDKIKIDRSFIAGIGHDRDAEMILRSVMGLGHSLHLKLVAEGVETAEQLAFLRREGCDLYQGWFYSPALSVEEFRATVHSQLDA